MRGVRVSSDGGLNFNKTHTFWASRLVIHPFSGRVHVDGFHSDDHGVTWSLPDGQPGLFGIDPMNAGRMFAPSGQGIQRTTDGGSTWKEDNKGIQEVLVTQVIADPYDLQVLYATTQNGLARRRKNEEPWKFPVLVGGLARNSWAIVAHPVNSGIIYTGDGSQVWRSADGGDFWEPRQMTASGGVFQMAIDPNDSQIVYATVASMFSDTTNDGLYGTVDGGLHWSRVGLAGLQVNAVQAVKDKNGTTLYAGVGDMWDGSPTGGVFRKRTNETEWTQVGPTGSVVVDIAVDPSDRRHLYIGVGPGSFPPNKPPYGVFESGNGGDTWKQVLNTKTEGAVWTLAIDPQNPDVLYAATFTTIYRSLNRGETWGVYYQGGEGSNIQALYMPSPPPIPVTSFTVNSDGAINRLSWTNPTNVGFTGTMIRYRTDRYPENCYDGILLANQAATPNGSDHTKESGSATYYL